MTKAFRGPFVLPAFVPVRGERPTSSLSDVTDLLRGQIGAMAVVRASRDLPLRVLEAAEGCRLDLVVVLEPGGDAIADLLDEVVAQATETPSHRVRALAGHWGDRQHDVLILTQSTVDDGGRLRLGVGAGWRFQEDSASCQIAMEPPPGLAEDVNDWFLGLWDRAVPLTRGAVAAYPVLLRSPSADVEASWTAFRQALTDLDPAEQPPTDAERRKRDGAGTSPKSSEADGVAVPASTDTADIRSSEPESFDDGGPAVVVRRTRDLDRELEAIYGRGGLVFIQTSTKLPPYKLDVAKVFGLARERRYRRASAKSPIDLELLPEEAKRSVRKLRYKASGIRSAHCFRLAEKEHWLPRAAESHFAATLKDAHLSVDLEEILGMKVDTYVEQEMGSFVKELNKALAGHPLQHLITPTNLDLLEVAIREELTLTSTVPIEVRFSVEERRPPSGPDPTYDRPLQLLRSAALATRRRLARKPQNDPSPTPEPPLIAFDIVGGDGLLSEEASWEVAAAARDQLTEIQAIVDTQADAEKKCVALIELLRRPLASYRTEGLFPSSG